MTITDFPEQNVTEGKFKVHQTLLMLILPKTAKERIVFRNDAIYPKFIRRWLIMGNITIESKPNKDRLQALGVAEWEIWTKEVSSLPWYYDAEETCYFLEGEVVVTPDGQPPV